MALTASERASLIQQYADGPAHLAAAWALVPAAARQWRPAPDAWSAHEIVIHCADAEATAAGRIRLLVVEAEPLIVNYDQEAWAITLDYHGHPIEPALTVIAAARANTVPLLRRLPETAWRRVGQHTRSGRYTGEDWLRIYAAHLEEHARQIEDNLAAWGARAGA